MRGVTVRDGRYRGWLFALLLLLAAEIGVASVAVADSKPRGVPYSLRAEDKVLVVGVRDVAKPFSFKTARRSGSRVMTGYGGYMIEICRRVLDEMVTEGYFAGYRVLTREVSAGNRFSLLDTGQVDILCGPDSITQERLQHYTTSHPVFLSGVVLVSRPAENFPRTRYCEGVVGMVRGTTASSSGLEQLLQMEDVVRFKPALLSFLAQYGENDARHFRTSMSDNLAAWIDSHGQRAVSDAPEMDGVSPIDPSLVQTGECPNGFDKGPVIFHANHQQGVESFCRGDTLFYLGDVDLLKSTFDALPACQKVFQRTTLTREAYGIYFRQVANIPEASFTPMNQRDAILYAQFNNILLRKMQDSERMLEYEYRQQFGDQEQGEDLVQFFKSFQYANNY